MQSGERRFVVRDQVGSSFGARFDLMTVNRNDEVRAGLLGPKLC